MLSKYIKMKENTQIFLKHLMPVYISSMWHIYINWCGIHKQNCSVYINKYLFSIWYHVRVFLINTVAYNSLESVRLPVISLWTLSFFCLPLPAYLCNVMHWRGKGRDLTQSWVLWQNPYTHRKIQNATSQHKNATKNFDYTTIADRLRTVSLSNSSQPTGVVKPVYERSTFQLITTAVLSKGYTFKNL